MQQSHRHCLASNQTPRELFPSRPRHRPVLAQVLFGILMVALVAILSLPQARVASATLGWVPFWLLAIPASAWCALWAAGQGARTQTMAGPLAQPRRRTSVPLRWRAAGNGRTPRRARAA